MALARRQGAGHSREIWRDRIRGVGGAEGRRRCQEGMLDEAGHEATPGVCRSSQDVGPRGKRLGQVQSVVQSGYGAREGMWGSGSLRQGSEEHVTGWSVTAT
jgi:hypothetical protein